MMSVRADNLTSPTAPHESSLERLGSRRSWTMPLGPHSFPDQEPISDSERAVLVEYVDTCVGRGSNYHWQRIMAHVDRVEQPLRQLVTFIRREFSPKTCASTIPVFRRLLYRQIVETREPFWLWKPATWQAVLAAMDNTNEREKYMRHWVGTGAYLFADMLPLAMGPVTTYSVAAQVFGSDLVMAESEAILSILRPADAGWSSQSKSDNPFRWFFALAMLVNGSPYLETYREDSLQRLAALKEYGLHPLPTRFDSLLGQFQSFLCRVGALDRPIVNTRRHDHS